jgi:hypothetical protein
VGSWTRLIPAVKAITVTGLILLSGCGGSSASKTSAPAQTQAMTEMTTAPAPPSISDAESYARSLLPGYRSELRKRGADLFGKTT